MSAIQQTAEIDSKIDLGVSDAGDAELVATIDKATQAISQKEFAAALSLLLPLMSEHSRNEEILYLVAVAQRYLGDNGSALQRLPRWLPVRQIMVERIKKKGTIIECWATQKQRLEPTAGLVITILPWRPATKDSCKC